MQAIFTKYIGPTNTRDARIKAWCEAGSVTIPCHDWLTSEEVHALAAHELRTKLGWTSWMIQGTAPQAGTNASYVFVLLDKDGRNRF